MMIAVLLYPLWMSQVGLLERNPLIIVLVVLLVVLREISELFNTIKSLFGL